VTEAQLSVIVGPIVALLFQWLKTRWAWLNCTDATVKQITVCIVVVLGVFAANGWAVTRTTIMAAVVAILASLGTHKALLAQPKPEVK
jgi:hypothetical protein